MHAEGPVPAAMGWPGGDALTLAVLLPLSAAPTLVLAHTAHIETSTMATTAILIMLIMLRLCLIFIITLPASGARASS
jgi:hypothetical protein